MKKKYLSLAAAILALASIVWFCGFREAPAEEGVLISVKTISEKDGFFNIQAGYPQFTDISMSFNDKISDLIADRISLFKESSESNWNARKATALPGEIIPEIPEVPFDFIAEWKPVQINEKYLSFAIDIYYFSGGAHGTSETVTFNYDISQKKEITIEDFLGNSQESFESLSQISAQQVAYQLQGMGIVMDDFMNQMVELGTRPTAENYDSFTFDHNSLKLYFQQYQVAPGAAGMITITIFKNILEDNSIFSDYLSG
jgi:hypothetical protein